MEKVKFKKQFICYLGSFLLLFLVIFLGVDSVGINKHNGLNYSCLAPTSNSKENTIKLFLAELKLKTAKEKVSDFIERGGKVNFVLILGGSNIRMGVVTDEGPVGEFLSHAWKSTDNPSKARRNIINSCVELFKEHIEQFQLSPADIGLMGISWAGIGNYKEGRVYGSNIQGFRSNELGLVSLQKGGVPLKRFLKAQLSGIGYGGIDIKIVPDGAAAALGEYNLLSGGKTLEVAHSSEHLERNIGQQGRFIIGIPDGDTYRFENRAHYDGSFPPVDHKNKGEVHASHLLSGPFVAQRFVDFLMNKRGEESAQKWMGLTDIPVAALKKIVTLEYGEDSARPKKQHRKVLVAKVHEAMNKKIKEEDPLMLEFVQQIETEIGRFLEIILRTYPRGYYISIILGTGLGSGFLKLEDPLAPSQIVLVGGLSEHFHKPKVGEVDEFIQHIRKGAGLSETSTQILRTKEGPYRDLYAFVPESPLKVQGMNGRAQESRKDIYQLISRLTQHFSEMFEAYVGKEGILFLSEKAVVGKGLQVKRGKALVLPCFDEEKGVVRVGDNVVVNATVEIDVEGSGEVVIASNVYLDKDIRLSVKDGEVAFVHSNGVSFLKEADLLSLARADDQAWGKVKLLHSAA